VETYLTPVGSWATPWLEVSHRIGTAQRDEAIQTNFVLNSSGEDRAVDPGELPQGLAPPTHQPTTFKRTILTLDYKLA
jgi:hypothetical protein